MYNMLYANNLNYNKMWYSSLKYNSFDKIRIFFLIILTLKYFCTTYEYYKFMTYFHSKQFLYIMHHGFM